MSKKILTFGVEIRNGMKWNTPVIIELHLGYLQHDIPLLLMGSCFADNMGQYLTAAKFNICVNPFGTLYNPESIAHAIERLMGNRAFTSEELSTNGNLWYSYHHHGDFSQPTQEDTLNAINTAYNQAANLLPHCQRLIITWGTAYVYRLKENGSVVANCHKQPDALFTRNRLSVEEITSRWSKLLVQLHRYAPQCKVLFTVSPIRHLRDGAHDNQLSKSTLLLAVEALCNQCPEMCSYFPAYEIVMDELRDYRFYAEDMTHPSQQTIAYLRERLADTYFTPETKALTEVCLKIDKGLQHKPLKGRNNEAYRTFATHLLQQMNQITEKYPYIDYDAERKELEHYLSL